eukprot:SAG31_NODE_2016_length_6663_cov_12.109385_5_plen_478_part_00
MAVAPLLLLCGLAQGFALSYTSRTVQALAFKTDDVIEALAALVTLNDAGSCRANGFVLDGWAELAADASADSTLHSGSRRVLQNGENNNGSSCADDPVTFQGMAQAVTTDCCDGTTQSCADGVATSCDAKCGMRYVPFYDTCRSTLSQMPQFDPNQLSSFDKLYETCRSLPLPELLTAVAACRGCAGGCGPGTACRSMSSSPCSPSQLPASGSPTTGAGPRSVTPDGATLVAFKQSGNGNGLDSWIASTTICGHSAGRDNDDGHGSKINSRGGGWAGVGCSNNADEDDVSVTRLMLDAQHNKQFVGLTGELTVLGRLERLKYLNLHKTAVTGYLSALSGLVHLQQLNLVLTPVVGSISALSATTQIRFLDLVNCHSIEGMLSDLSGLALLEQLFMDGTRLRGDISTLAELTHLTTISLFDTRVAGNLASLNGMDHLEELYLGNTAVRGDAVEMAARLATLCVPTGVDNWNEVNAAHC